MVLVDTEMLGSDTFVEPTSIQEADDRLIRLNSDIQEIQAQFGDKQRVDDDGRRMQKEEYQTWKKRAQHALNQKLNDLRTIKLWIRTNRHSTQSPLSIATGHVADLSKMLAELQEDGVDFDDTEKAKIDAAQEFLRRVTATRKKHDNQETSQG